MRPSFMIDKRRETMLKERKPRRANLVGEYYEARRKALIDLAEARKRLVRSKRERKNRHNS